MSVTTSICQCCGKEKTTDQYAPRRAICALCAGLSAYDAVTLARATAARLAAAENLVKQSAVERRRAIKLAQYADIGKRCTSCHSYKPIEDYNKCAPAADGLQPICRACDKTRVTLMTTGSTGSRTRDLELWHMVQSSLRAQADQK